MPSLTVAAVSLNQTPLDFVGNRRRIIEAVADASLRGADIVCLPELAITGYGCEDAFLFPWVAEHALSTLKALLPYTAHCTVAVGLPLIVNTKRYNAVCVVSHGAIRGFVCKKHLANDGIHYERRWFTPWQAGASSLVTIEGAAYPVGDLVFDVYGTRIGFEICEDAWVPDRPAPILARAGVALILNPSASHFAFSKCDVRREIAVRASRLYGVSYVFANLLGNESGRAIYDGDTLVVHAGEIVASGPRFSFRDGECSLATLSLAGASQSPHFIGSPTRVAISGVGPQGRVTAMPPCRHLEGWEVSERRKEEEFTRAVGLGLFDYHRKSRSNGFVVSLSGGADSAAVAVLTWSMLDRACREWGVRDACERLGVTPSDSIVEMRRALLTCVYQSLPNSSETTRSAATAIAGALGCEYLVVELADVLRQYQSIAAAHLGRPLSWAQDDITLQNLQARVRSPGVWMLANMRRALLLVTSNRSEAAVGYCTMDGDSSGGLAPIGGVDKDFLRQWLRWFQCIGPEGIGPLSALEVITSQEPTAELRPPEMGQTDETDLMPYEVVAALESLLLVERTSPSEWVPALASRFGNRYDERSLFTWSERFWALWRSSQWKRERYAPTFHLDAFSVDPKTWCRFPILSGSGSADSG